MLNKKTPEVCFKQLQEFDYYVLIVYFNNFLYSLSNP